MSGDYPEPDATGTDIANSKNISTTRVTFVVPVTASLALTACLAITLVVAWRRRLLTNKPFVVKLTEDGPHAYYPYLVSLYLDHHPGNGCQSATNIKISMEGTIGHTDEYQIEPDEPKRRRTCARHYLIKTAGPITEKGLVAYLEVTECSNNHWFLNFIRIEDVWSSTHWYLPYYRWLTANDMLVRPNQGARSVLSLLCTNFWMSTEDFYFWRYCTSCLKPSSTLHSLVRVTLPLSLMSSIMCVTVAVLVVPFVGSPNVPVFLDSHYVRSNLAAVLVVCCFHDLLALILRHIRPGQPVDDSVERLQVGANELVVVVPGGMSNGKDGDLHPRHKPARHGPQDQVICKRHAGEMSQGSSRPTRDDHAQNVGPHEKTCPKHSKSSEHIDGRDHGMEQRYTQPSQQKSSGEHMRNMKEKTVEQVCQRCGSLVMTRGEKDLPASRLCSRCSSRMKQQRHLVDDNNTCSAMVEFAEQLLNRSGLRSVCGPAAGGKPTNASYENTGTGTTRPRVAVNDSYKPEQFEYDVNFEPVDWASTSGNKEHHLPSTSNSRQYDHYHHQPQQQTGLGLCQSSVSPLSANKYKVCPKHDASGSQLSEKLMSTVMNKINESRSEKSVVGDQKANASGSFKPTPVKSSTSNVKKDMSSSDAYSSISQSALSTEKLAKNQLLPESATKPIQSLSSTSEEMKPKTEDKPIFRRDNQRRRSNKSASSEKSAGLASSRSKQSTPVPTPPRSPPSLASTPPSRAASPTSPPGSTRQSPKPRADSPAAKSASSKNSSATKVRPTPSPTVNEAKPRTPSPTGSPGTQSKQATKPVNQASSKSKDKGKRGSFSSPISEGRVKAKPPAGSRSRSADVDKKEHGDESAVKSRSKSEGDKTTRHHKQKSDKSGIPVRITNKQITGKDQSAERGRRRSSSTNGNRVSLPTNDPIVRAKPDTNTKTTAEGGGASSENKDKKKRKHNDSFSKNDAKKSDSQDKPKHHKKKGKDSKPKSILKDGAEEPSKKHHKKAKGDSSKEKGIMEEQPPWDENKKKTRPKTSDSSATKPVKWREEGNSTKSNSNKLPSGLPVARQPASRHSSNVNMSQRFSQDSVTCKQTAASSEGQGHSAVGVHQQNVVCGMVMVECGNNGHGDCGPVQQRTSAWNYSDIEPIRCEIDDKQPIKSCDQGEGEGGKHRSKSHFSIKHKHFASIRRRFLAIFKRNKSHQEVEKQKDCPSSRAHLYEVSDAADDKCNDNTKQQLQCLLSADHNQSTKFNEYSDEMYQENSNCNNNEADAGDDKVTSESNRSNSTCGVALGYSNVMQASTHEGIAIIENNPDMCSVQVEKQVECYQQSELLFNNELTKAVTSFTLTNEVVVRGNFPAAKPKYTGFVKPLIFVNDCESTSGVDTLGFNSDNNDNDKGNSRISDEDKFKTLSLRNQLIVPSVNSNVNVNNSADDALVLQLFAYLQQLYASSVGDVCSESFTRKLNSLKSTLKGDLAVSEEDSFRFENITTRTFIQRHEMISWHPLNEAVQSVTSDDDQQVSGDRSINKITQSVLNKIKTSSMLFNPNMESMFEQCLNATRDKCLACTAVGAARKALSASLFFVTLDFWKNYSREHLLSWSESLVGTLDATEKYWLQSLIKRATASSHDLEGGGGNAFGIDGKQFNARMLTSLLQITRNCLEFEEQFTCIYWAAVYVAVILIGAATYAYQECSRCAELVNSIYDKGASSVATFDSSQPSSPISRYSSLIHASIVTKSNDNFDESSSVDLDLSLLLTDDRKRERLLAVLASTQARARNLVENFHFSELFGAPEILIGLSQYLDCESHGAHDLLIHAIVHKIRLAAIQGVDREGQSQGVGSRKPEEEFSLVAILNDCRTQHELAHSGNCTLPTPQSHTAGDGRITQKGYDRPPPAYRDINGQPVEAPPNDGSSYYHEYSEFVDVSQIGPRSKQQGQGGDQYDSSLANQSSNAAYKPPTIYPWVMPMQKPHSCIVTLFFILFITLSSTVAVSTTIYLGMYLSYQGSLVWLSNFSVAIILHVFILQPLLVFLVALHATFVQSNIV